MIPSAAASTEDPLTAPPEPLTTQPRPPSGTPRLRPGRRGALRDLLAMQADLKRSMLAATTKPNEKARLVEAWDRLEDRKRILRGRPLPGSFTHEKVKRPRLPRGLTESMLATVPIEQAAGPLSA